MKIPLGSLSMCVLCGHLFDPSTQSNLTNPERAIYLSIHTLQVKAKLRVSSVLFLFLVGLGNAIEVLLRS